MDGVDCGRRAIMARATRPHVLLLNPPVVKPSEPPPGLARLAGALHHFGIPCKVVDLNIEGLFSLMDTPRVDSDRWTQRSFRNRLTNLDALRGPDLYRNFDRYHRSVMDLNRVIGKTPASSGFHLTLVNFQHCILSPVNSRDLLRAAEVPEENPFFPYFELRLTTLIGDENPTIVGLSLNFLSQALCTFALIGLLRGRFPGLSLVLGGGLVTSWVRRPGWKNPFSGLVDHLVAGPGELALLSFAGLQHAEERHFIPNFDDATTPFRDTGKDSGGDSGLQHPTPGTFHPSLFTPHALRLTPRSPYLAPGFVLPYSAAGGCYWNRCAFCPERAEANPYLPIPVDRVVTQLQVLAQTTTPVLIHLLDNALSPPLLKALATNPMGVPWYGFARITEQFVDEDFCRALQHSGCVMLQLGVESGDQGVLDHEGKGIDLSVVARALKNLRTAGIATYVYLLFGTPSETIVEARKTLQFTVAHAAEIGFLNLAVFNLPIYGPETDKLRTRMHYEGDLSLYVGFDHPRGWHRAQVRQFLDKEFKRHPAVAPIIRRDPPFFTSNHAPFFAP